MVVANHLAGFELWVAGQQQDIAGRGARAAAFNPAGKLVVTTRELPPPEAFLGGPP
ncbi:hypothetical protein ACLQ26_22340 [Micromonospora sp. DT43]|uniref:hypothetical protein n=1 Tax=Micromonospora sp. DT43 TaxID=3393440 RepID=UPI003CF57927